MMVVIIFLCAALGLGVFIATFDANRYGRLVVQKASEAIGRPVHLGHLSLVWKNGIALRLEDLIVYADAGKKSKALSLQEASVVVRLLPLLHKEIQIASVVLVKPVVQLVRNAEGSVQIMGVSTPTSPAAQPGPGASGSSSSSMLLSVNSFTIQKGEVDFEDHSPASPVSLSVRDLDVKVKKFSLTQPFSFDVATALFSAKQNVHLSGLLKLPQSGQTGYLEKAIFQTGLADWDLAKLAKAFPAVKAAGLEGNMGGKFQLECKHMDLGTQSLKNLEASAKLLNGAVKLQSLDSPFENIQLSARVLGGNIEVENFSAKFAKGVVKGSGAVQKFQTQAISDIKYSASELSIEDLAAAGGQAPHLGGRLSLDLTGSARGLTWPQISQTLSGQGHLVLKDGVLLNYNLLREVVQKISIIPGAEGVLQQQLPNLYKAKLGEPSTLLAPIDLPFVIQNGRIMFDRLVLATDFILLEGSGEVGLDKTIQARSTLHIHRDLSSVMVSLLPQIQILTNGQGEIEIPVQIQGQFSRVMILPDKDYLTQKLLSAQAQQFVTGLVKDPSKGIQQVRNLLDKPIGTGEAGVKNSVQELFGSKSGLKNLLNQAIGQQSSSASSNQGDKSS